VLGEVMLCYVMLCYVMLCWCKVHSLCMEYFISKFDLIFMFSIHRTESYAPASTLRALSSHIS